MTCYVFVMCYDVLLDCDKLLDHDMLPDCDMLPDVTCYQTMTHVTYYQTVTSYLVMGIVMCQGGPRQSPEIQSTLVWSSCWGATGSARRSTQRGE